jgi:hypothetical protein
MLVFALLLLLALSKISGAAAMANAWDAMYLTTSMSRAWRFTRAVL